jgi:WD40 repeat protein
MTVPFGPDIPAELVAQSSTFVESATALDWIAKRLSEGPSFLVLVAEPGFGKTSIAVQLAQISLGAAPPTRSFAPGWLHAWHFCQARRYESLDTRAVLERLAAQLCRTVPGYAEEIAQPVGNTSITVTQTVSGDVHGSTVAGIGNLVLPATEPRKLLHDFIRKPLARLGSDVTVLVDAINESDEQCDPTSSLAWLLASVQVDPIPQLRLVLTTRNGTTARRFSSGHLNLRDIRSTAVDDVHAYTLRRLRDAGVPEPVPLAARISDAADGNFLYAVHAVSQYLSEPTSGALTLPVGLAELYREFLSRRAAADVGRWHSVVRPVLALLVQSRGEGFTRRQLAAISGLAPSIVDEALERCSPFLLGDFDGPLVPHHEALREYLRMSPQHSIHPLEATRRIVGALRGAVTDPHAVTHLLGYLADYHRLAEREDTVAALRAAEQTLTDPAYLHARLAAAGIDSLLAEIGTLLRTIGDSWILDTIHGALTRQAHNLRQWDPNDQPTLALRQIQYDCASSGAPDLVAVAAGEGEPALHVEWSAGRQGTWLLSHTFTRTEDHYQAMALSSDSTMVALAYLHFNTRVHVHELETGAVVRSFSCDGHISDMCFSDDDQKVLVRQQNSGIVTCNLTTGEKEPATREDVLLIQQKSPPSLPTYIDAVRDHDHEPVAATTPDGRYAVALCHQLRRQFVAVWDLQRREIIGVHFDTDVDSLAITADGKKVIVGRLIGNSYILSPPPRTYRTSHSGHQVAVQAVALRGHRAVSIGVDGTLKVRDSSSGRPEHTVNGQPHVASIDITPDGGHCIVGTYQADIEVFDPDLQLVVRKLAVDGIPVDELWKSRDGAREPTLPPMGFDEPYPPKRPIRLYVDDVSAAITVDVSVDGRFAVTGTTDGVLRTWDLDTGSLVREFTRDGCFIPAARFTPDGRNIVTVSQVSGLYVPCLVSVDMWSIASGNRVDRLWPPPVEHPYEVTCEDAVAITRDGRYLATTSADGTLVVHDLVGGREIGRLTLHGRFLRLAIDDTRVLVGTDRGEVTLIRFRGGAW